jgi:hypothetical protein
MSSEKKVAMYFPVIFGQRRGAVVGTLVVGVALGISSLGIVDAERAKPNAVKTFKCKSLTACVQASNTSVGGAVSGISAAGNGVFGEVYSPNFGSFRSAGVEGRDESGVAQNVGVYGASSAGIGVSGYSGAAGPSTSPGVGVSGEVGSNGSVGGGAAVQAQTDDILSDVFHGYGNFNGAGETLIDGLGNILTSGKIYTVGSCKNGCLRTRDSDRRAVSYTPRESLPSMEDTGESRLEGGRAYVRIDPALANVIDSGAEFSVFLTPEGDSRGLYVTQKSPTGFAVRENQGGRSTLSFAYRIVAKPYADVSSRLPMRTLPLHTITSARRDASH